MFITYTIDDGGEQTVRDLLPGISGLVKSVSFRVPDDDLRCVVGIGSSAWSRLYASDKPKQLHTLETIVGDKYVAPSTPGDLLFHLQSSHLDMCFELARLINHRLQGHATIVDEVHGFKYFDQRDLLGFVDGTANPEGVDAVKSVVISHEADPEYAGGTYVITQKYTHQLQDWHAISVEEQERVIGRSKLDDVEMPDDVKPSNSHIALNTITDDNGVEHDIYRENMPFGEIGEDVYGTYFIGYAADPSVTELMLRHMFIGNPRGNYDRILDYSTAHTGNLFFIPSVERLDTMDELKPAQ